MEPDHGRVAVAFGRVLRAAGLDVPVGSVATYARALDAVGLTDPAAVYWAGRTTLVTAPEHIATYDETFAAFWSPDRTRSLRFFTAYAPDKAQRTDEVGVRYSAREVLRQKDFAAYTKDEHAEARQLMGDLRLAGALRR